MLLGRLGSGGGLAQGGEPSICLLVVGPISKPLVPIPEGLVDGC